MNALFKINELLFTALKEPQTNSIKAQLDQEL